MLSYFFYHKRFLQWLCLVAALWFVFSPALKVLLAHASGKHIEIVVCTGAGIKKISVPMDAPSADGHGAVFKHCSNTPLVILQSTFGTQQDLSYVKPQTPNTWQATYAPQTARQWVLNGWPPPGRAPPLLG